MKQVLIIGCGYLGSHLANYFNQKKNRVKIIGRKSVYTEILHQEIKFYNIDINNIDDVKKYIEKDDTVIYAAGSLNATNLFSDIIPDMQEYYPSFINLLDICENVGIQKFVFLSSAGTVYGSTDTPAREDFSLNPTNIYGLQKVFFENLIKIKHHETNRLPYLILRVSNPYGGFQNPNKNQGIIPVLIKKALADDEFIFWGNVNAIRDFIYIDDFLEAIYLSIQIEDSEVINIGSGIGTTIKEVISIVEQSLQKKMNIVHKNIGQKTIMSNKICVKKLNLKVGYYPTFTLGDGISIMISSIYRETK